MKYTIIGMKTEAKQILKLLFSSKKGLTPYSIYLHTKIDPYEAAAVIGELIKKGAIIKNEDVYRISSDFRRFLLSHSRHLALSQKPWLNIPSIFLEMKIDINSPFIPSIREVSKDILIAKKDNSV